MIEPIIKQLEPIVVDELRTANLTNPPFHSRHEGMAVIMEEVDECQDEYDMVKTHMEAVKYHVFRDHLFDADETVGYIEDRAVKLAAEAIQVAAMCEKWKDKFNE